jgi:hypothetical protein
MYKVKKIGNLNFHLGASKLFYHRELYFKIGYRTSVFLKEEGQKESKSFILHIILWKYELSIYIENFKEPIVDDYIDKDGFGNQEENNIQF